ncbi:MAG TPA: hypothetical protein PLR44_01580 [Thermomicrobiales bacterium]|jgi:hypothetical protein|nr:hypothetical protein [Chloroflexota bacterium]HBY47280.1 hypothetical protein [Chloroflexota bacterium]HCG30336.1 hypothetical protein [Chloroflexota bacterium]HQZ88727.1 hypothetical protein [Thermomicrobiales bacterium]HRA32639.1 hypothetical protein [Thermomicrobiales bacterium]
MNARDGLERIRERLIANAADPDTLSLLDTMISRASAPGAERAQATQSQLVRMLVRSPVATNNFHVYNDLVRLEAEVNEVAAQRAAAAEAEADKPVPKSKKYYKQLKEREKREA